MTEYLVCIDPGEWAGFSCWYETRLVSCGRFLGFEALGNWAHDSKCVCELPRIYPHSKTKRPNDIVTLAITAGRLTSQWEEKDITWIPPHEWKAQVPDDILEARILTKLSPEERVLLEFLDLPKTRRHNVTDAIGLGLKHLRRMGVGGS